MNNPIKKMLRTHKEYCQTQDQKVVSERACTCGRDKAVELYEEIEDYLLYLNVWMEEHGIAESSPVVSHELDQIVVRL